MITRRARAIQSIIEIADWISVESPKSALRFLDSVEATLLNLEKHQEMGRTYHALNPKLLGIRVWRVKNFKRVLIFYRPQTYGIEVLDLIHGARDFSAILDDLL
jgi:plasmid stabilization system protein ParE